MKAVVSVSLFFSLFSLLQVPLNRSYLCREIIVSFV